MMIGGARVDQRDIVLIPFPFSDLSESKLRPSLIISDENYNRSTEDVILCAITSKPIRTKYDIEIDTSDLEKGKLRMKSKVRPDKIFTIKKSKISRKFGKLNEEKSIEVIESINQIIEIKG